MKSFLKAGLMTAAVLTAISVAPAADAHAYKDTRQGMRNQATEQSATREWNRSGITTPQTRSDWRRSDVAMNRYGGDWSNRAIATSELPINRGVGRGSNKPMLDLNRGVGTTVTAEPMTGYTPPSDRDRYYGAFPAGYESGGWNGYDSRDAGWRRAPSTRYE